MSVKFKYGIRRAFTLIETVLALALFAMAATAVSQICYNCIFALDMKGKAAQEDEIKDQFAKAIMGVADYDSLSSGTEVEAIDGETYQVTATAEPTAILDLFDVEITAQRATSEVKMRIFLIRPNWYENTNDRDDIIKDRTDFLDEKRRSEEAVK